MNDLIENLLAYNRLSQMRLQAEEFPLTLLLEEVLLAMGDQIRARSATVRVDSPPLEVLADRQVLFLLLTQLVSNALKFVRPGVPPDVTLRAERKGASLRLSVQDNGIGISREYHEQIWKPGTRLNPIETYPGTGMGLAIVAKAADRLLGRLGLESEEGNGSRFWVDLPVEPE